MLQSLQPILFRVVVDIEFALSINLDNALAVAALNRYPAYAVPAKAIADPVGRLHMRRMRERKRAVRAEKEITALMHAPPAQRFFIHKLFD